ncbi:MAG: response regulator [Alphaproteobacteria bacterium]|nr:response regulator [Alphaproteobacteria bacterium]
MRLTLNVRGMLLALCIAFCEVLFCLGWVAWRSENQLRTIVGTFYDSSLASLDAARDAQAWFLRFAAAHGNPAASGTDEASRRQLRVLLDDLDAAASHAMSAEARAAANAAAAQVGALASDPKAKPDFAQLDGAIESMVKRFSADASEYRAQAEELITYFDQWWRRLIAVCVLFFALIIISLSRAILKPLNRAAEVASAIAEGQLDNKIAVSGHGEPARLLGALSRVQDSIVENNKKMTADRAELVATNSQLHFTLLALEKREKELQIHKDNLENVIEERTAELARNNEQLSREVSEHRQTQENLVTAKELAEEANLAKTQFLANMSHEIRTPMNAISGMVDLLSRTELAPRQRHFTAVIKRSAAALLKVINDVLDFSKIESGHLGLSLGSVDLRAVIQEVEQLLIEVANEKGIELTRSVADEVPRTVQGDAMRLRQVLINLVGNAIKFTDQGGVSIQVVSLERNDDQVRIRIEVRDTGCGIPQEAIGSIFDPFRQVDGAMNRKVEGTGLGLAIVRQLIEIMGGRIEVDSEVGRGSVFRVELPFAVLESEPVAPQRGATYPGARALIIDDNPAEQDVIERGLWTLGIISSSVDSAKAALDELASAKAGGQPYDLVLSGNTASGLRGVDLALRLRKDAATADLPLVILAPRGQLLYAELQTLGERAVVLTKPVNEAELPERVAAVLPPPSGVIAELRPPARGERDELPAPRLELNLRVLVAEDHPVNQEIAREHLESFGCRVDMASNGQEAVAAFDTRNYDLILMDCQMPEMDGFEATRAIRTREAMNMDTAARRVPIIALTAHAMIGDRDRCIRAGMDDYLSKPFDGDDLYRMVDRWKPRGATRKETPRPQSAAVKRIEAEAVLDANVLQSLKRGFSPGGPSLLKRVGRLYLDFTPKDLAEIESAMDTEDAATVKTIAHKLKSASASVGAKSLAKLFKDLELAAAANRLRDADETLQQIKIEFERAAAALQNHMTAA